MEIVAIVIVIVLIIVYLVFRIKRSSNKTTEPTVVQKPYAAVKIDPCESPCSAAFDTAARIFLSREAPKLPLQNCDRTSQCHCKYIHYDDRRQNHDDRRSGSLVMQDVFKGENRRVTAKRGRRKDD